MNFRSCLLIAGAALPFLLIPDSAAEIVFHDDLENGSGNWSVYSFPATPTCTPLAYATTASYPNANHTPGGVAGFRMTRPSDRLVHDLNPAAYGGLGLHLSLWYYDAMYFTGSDFEAFDLRTQNNSQILGFATMGNSYGQPGYYWCRVLSVTGKEPAGDSGYRVTPVQRSLGWHRLEIMQYRDMDHLNIAEFYVDGMLAMRRTDALDATLSRVVLGLGWTYNSSQTGYVDDITVQIVPEPGTRCLLAAALIAFAWRKPLPKIQNVG